MHDIAKELAKFLEDFPDDWMYKDSWYDKYFFELERLLNDSPRKDS